MTRTQPRRSRIRPAAAVACLTSLVVMGLALWGLQRDPVPELADFDQTSQSVQVPRPHSDEAADGAQGRPFGGVPAPEPEPSPGDSADVGGAGDGEAESEDGAESGDGEQDARLVPRPQVRPASVEAAAQRSARPTPVRLRAPDVGLDVLLDPVGVQSDGQMEVPEDADVAGWYRFGPRPGDKIGSVVVAGHVDDRNGPGAFLALTGAQEGHEVIVELDDGSSVIYTVTARKTTDKKELPVDDLFDRDGAPRLHLITCTGEWSSRTSSYTDNLVITATPAQT